MNGFVKYFGCISIELTDEYGSKRKGKFKDYSQFASVKAGGCQC